MLRLLVTSVSLPSMSEVVQLEGLNSAYRFRVYHIAMAFAEVSVGSLVVEMRPVSIWSLDRFVSPNWWYWRYRIRCIL